MVAVLSERVVVAARVLLRHFVQYYLQLCRRHRHLAYVLLAAEAVVCCLWFYRYDSGQLLVGAGHTIAELDFAA